VSEKPIVRVKDVMKTDFDMVDGLSTVADALRNAQHLDTKCLIVDKRHEDDEYGIVLLSDIARQVLAVDRPPNRVNIYEIMTKPVVHVRPSMDIRYCARLFDNLTISRAPVIKNGEVLGIVSMTDMVIKGLLKNME